MSPAIVWTACTHPTGSHCCFTPVQGLAHHPVEHCCTPPCCTSPCCTSPCCTSLCCTSQCVLPQLLMHYLLFANTLSQHHHIEPFACLMSASLQITYAITAILSTIMDISCILHTSLISFTGGCVQISASRWSECPAVVCGGGPLPATQMGSQHAAEWTPEAGT